MACSRTRPGLLALRRIPPHFNYGMNVAWKPEAPHSSATSSITNQPSTLTAHHGRVERECVAGERRQYCWPATGSEQIMSQLQQVRTGQLSSRESQRWRVADLPRQTGRRSDAGLPNLSRTRPEHADTIATRRQETSRLRTLPSRRRRLRLPAATKATQVARPPQEAITAVHRVPASYEHDRSYL